MIRFYSFCLSVLAIIAALLVLTSVPSIAQSSGVINGCVGTLTAGAVRIVANPNQCAPGIEIPITWNIPGSQGAQGPPGPQGMQGPQGPEGPLAAAGGVCNRECAGFGVIQIHYFETDSNGQQSCPDEPTVTVHCDPYACNPDTDGCVTRCLSASDCLPGYICTEFTGVCELNVMTCRAGVPTQLVGPGGQTVSCHPYRCSQETNNCIAVCRSTADCDFGFVCSADGECVEPG